MAHGKLKKYFALLSSHLISDSAVKQIILGLNEKGQFIIEDLDDTHVFVDASCVDQLREDIDQILNENTYKVEDAK